MCHGLKGVVKQQCVNIWLARNVVFVKKTAIFGRFHEWLTSKYCSELKSGDDCLRLVLSLWNLI